MARSFSYQDTEEGGIQFITNRKIGDVRIPNYVYDMWMPVIGSDAIGVYAVYCRLEMQGSVKKMSLAKLAAACRIGVKKLNSINEKLERCRFIKISKPTGTARLMHWTTKIEIYDPPQQISKELIDEFCNGDYSLLTPWFKDEQTISPESSNGNSDEVKGTLDKGSNGNSKIAALELQPLKDAPPPEKKFGIGPVTDLLTGKQVSEQTAPNPQDQWFEYSDQFIKLFHRKTKRYPNEDEKQLISEFVGSGKATPEQWQHALSECNLHYGGQRVPVPRVIEVCEAGSYEQWKANKWPDKKNSNNQPATGPVKANDELGGWYV